MVFLVNVLEMFNDIFCGGYCIMWDKSDSWGGVILRCGMYGKGWGIFFIGSYSIKGVGGGKSIF